MLHALRAWHSIALVLMIGVTCCTTISAQKPSPSPIPAPTKEAARSVKEAPSPSPTPPSERPPAMVELLNDARVAAPELTVETILGLIDSKKIKDREWRRELLAEALRLTDEVKYSVRKESAGLVLGGVVDTVAGYMTYAYNERLDALTLKSRIIKAWLADDTARAREMVFFMGGDLKLKPLKCDDGLIYEPSEIYSAVSAVADSAFTQGEIKEGVRGLFLLPWIENIQSPTQIMPVLEIITELRSSPAEQSLLINAFGRAINRNFGDDRSFTHVFKPGTKTHKVAVITLMSSERAQLTAAWRDMLVKNVAGPRCLENKPRTKNDLPQPIASFNELFEEMRRFKPEDFESVDYSGAVKDKLYMESVGYRKISKIFRSARDTKNRPDKGDDKAAQLEWQLRVGEMLEALDAWTSSAEEPDAEVFNQKTVFYRSLIPEVGEPALKETVVRAYMRYLAGSKMQKDSFIEWIYHARDLHRREPELFTRLAEEFPNPNFRLMMEARKNGI